MLNKLLFISFIFIGLINNQFMIFCQYEEDPDSNNGDNNQNEDSFDGEEEFYPNPNDANKIYSAIITGEAPVQVNDTSFIIQIIPYNNRARPGGINGSNTNIDSKGSLIIKALVSMRQLIALDEKLQVLTTSFYLMLKWNDPRLMWNPKNFNNLKRIIVPATQFWLPDVAFINAASTPSLITYQHSQNALITNDGTMYVSLYFPSLQTRCKLDVYTYPFDTQQCQITLGSWAFDSTELNFESMGIITTNYMNHPIWSLDAIRLQTSMNRNRFELINREYSSKMNLSQIKAEDLQIRLTLRRNPLYIMINGIFPCFVLNCVILISFGVPYAQQVALCMTSFLTYIMCSVRISNDIPVQAEYLPLITLYFLLSILYTFIGFAWFICLEILSKKKTMHPALILTANITKKCLFFLFKSPSVQPSKAVSKKETEENPSKQIEIAPKVLSKCNFCNRCEECTTQLQKEKKTKQEQAEFGSNITALNYLVWIMLFAFVFCCNTAIWVNIGVKTK